MKGEGGVAGEGSVVGVPKFHSRDKCTMPLTNINSDWMSNASSGLCINLLFMLFMRVLYFASWGVIKWDFDWFLIPAVVLGTYGSNKVAGFQVIQR